MKKINENTLEIIIAISLGVVALLTAWASWIGALHGGNQATNYAKSNNISSEANSEWNEASQNYLNDLETWNNIYLLAIDSQYAEDRGDAAAAEVAQWKMEQIMTTSTTPEFLEAIQWAMAQEGDTVTPFDMEGYFDSYYEKAQELYAEAQATLEQGQQDNSNGDKLGLVTVFYSVVLFLLGIVGTFKNIKNKVVLLIFAAVCFVVATVLMVFIPLPTGFSLTNFFPGA